MNDLGITVDKTLHFNAYFSARLLHMLIECVQPFLVAVTSILNLPVS